MPALVQSVKSAGLVLVACASSEIPLPQMSKVDGVLQPNGILKFEETIDI